ncbi:MAG: GAF domain-containing protein [Anaerolineae bacterium]|nr:GAF domain-containing protein [Anaerolineae bacterium]
MGADQSERYREILEQVIEASGAERGCIVTLNLETGQPDMVASVNWEKVAAEDQYAFKLVSSQVFAENTPIITTNVDQQAPTFQSIDDFRVFVPRSILCMPFQINHILSILYLDSRLLQRTFSGKDIQHLQSLLAQYTVDPDQ